MARGESQGLQIALILFVMLTVVLSVTTYMFWSRSQQLTQQLDAAQDDARNNRAGMNDALDFKNNVLSYIGHSPDAAPETVEEDFKADMQLFGQSVPEENRNYRELPKHLSDVVHARNEQVADASDREKRLLAEKESISEQEKNLVAAAVKVQTQVEDELRSERDKFNDERNTVRLQSEKLASQLADQRAQVENVNQKTDQAVAAVNEELKRKDRAYELLKEENDKFKSETFEVPDGEIAWVEHRNGIAWINLGSADGIRRQGTFSVYEKDVNNLGRAEKKASIEITKVTGSHMAQARIMDAEPANPVMAGDLIFSPVWTIGSKLHFALAGEMDIDGDGESDRREIRSVIRTNGGIIDAEDGIDGGEPGKLTIKTRYLVLGDRPTVSAQGRNVSEEDLARFSNLMNQAERLQIEVLPIDRLIEWMGYRSKKRTVALGKGLRAADFPPQPREAVRSRTLDQELGRTPEYRRKPSKIRGLSGSI